MAPMGTLHMINPDGSLTQRIADYYIERAKGGVGLIITTAFKVENDMDALRPGIVPVMSVAALPLLAEISETLHSLGAKIFVQLSAGFGRVAPPTMLSRAGTAGAVRSQPVSASAIPNLWDPSITCRELTAEEVEKFVKAFGSAAKIALNAGVDGIELMAMKVTS